MKNPPTEERALAHCLSPDEPLAARVRELEVERERLEVQVLELQRASEAGLLTGGLAHDLFNQLTSLMGSAELALMQAHPEALREGLRAGLRHGYRMHETIDAFLGFVRRREERTRRFVVEEAMGSVERLIVPVARAQGVEFIANCATRAEIEADRQLIEQVLVNLAMNAVRAAASGAGRVVIAATDGDLGVVRIAVRDTGPGIREDIRERLFEPFATGHESSGGTGLGLYVVRQVVRRYGGRISVETSPAGTRIEVELPVAAAGVPPG